MNFRSFLCRIVCSFGSFELGLSKKGFGEEMKKFVATVGECQDGSSGRGESWQDIESFDTMQEAREYVSERLQEAIESLLGKLVSLVSFFSAAHIV